MLTLSSVKFRALTEPTAGIVSSNPILIEPMQSDPEYFSRPRFLALGLNSEQLRAARSLPRRLSQIFGHDIELWLDILAERVLDLRVQVVKEAV